MASQRDSDQLYRLLPVEKSKAYEYESISFMELLNYYWSKRNIIYWSLGIFLIIGLFFAFFSPIEYESRTSIVPEYEIQDRVSEVIAQYGMLFGLIGNIPENRPPMYLMELYPHMVNSVSFQKKLMRKPFSYSKSNTEITFYEYFTEMHRPTLMHTIHKYTLGLPGTIAGTLSPDPETQLQEDSPPSAAADSINARQTNTSVFKITDLKPAEKRVISQLRSRISASYQRRVGIIALQAKMPDRELAAKAAQLTLEVLHESVSEYKTAKARTYKKFLIQQQKKAESAMEEARTELGNFMASESQAPERRIELQSRYEMMLNRYNSVTQQLEHIELSIQEQIPVFRILDDITVPGQKSEPNRKLIIIFSLFLGFFIAICWITIVFLSSTLKTKTS